MRVYINEIYKNLNDINGDQLDLIYSSISSITFSRVFYFLYWLFWWSNLIFLSVCLSILRGWRGLTISSRIPATGSMSTLIEVLWILTGLLLMTFSKSLVLP